MSEFDLIEMIRAATATRRADVVLGIGDDGAVLRVPRGQDLVVAMDTLVAGVHFPESTPPDAIGWKALAVNLSDLAAMGATPAWTTLALTLPRAAPRWVERFAAGYADLSRRHGVALVGGDTTRGPLSITVQAHGFVPPGVALRRSGARAGDAVYVSGTLGDAAAGLALAQRRLRARGERRAALLERLQRPAPRLALGEGLRGIASACIDVSDGLLADLGHVLAASRVGAAIDLGVLPSSAALLSAAPDALARRGLQLAGDDYELCFCVPRARTARVESIAARLRIPLTRIGSITKGRGLRVTDVDGRPLAPAATGWDHFRR